MRLNENNLLEHYYSFLYNAEYSGEDYQSREFKDSLSTTMQRAPKRRFRGPRNPKVLRRHLKAVQICLHPSHPSVEWIEIFLWSYEIYQGTIGAVLI